MLGGTVANTSLCSSWHRETGGVAGPDGNRLPAGASRVPDVCAGEYARFVVDRRWHCCGEVDICDGSAHSAPWYPPGGRARVAAPRAPCSEMDGRVLPGKSP